MPVVTSRDGTPIVYDTRGTGPALVVVDGALTVSGERKAEHATKSDGYYRVERAFGAFTRTVTLPKGINADAVSASFDRGVFEVIERHKAEGTRQK